MLIKLLVLLIVVISILKYNIILFNNYFENNKNYLNLNIKLNSSLFNKIINKIKIGTFTYYLENGGRSRIISFLLNNLYRIKIFNLYLFSIKIKDDNEYLIQKNINRILIKNYNINNLIKSILKKKLDVFIYHFSQNDEIEALNKLKKNIKILLYQHQSIFFWIYTNFTSFKYLYKSYKESKYIVSLIHLENDYIFEKWGIKSIFMNNFMTYEYNSSFQLDLFSKTILMIGRLDNKYKRLVLGLQAMEYITNEIPEIEMKVIGNITNNLYLMNIINILGLDKNIKFYGYTPIPEKYFKNVSLNIITSISESFCLVLSETKIYGIPNIVINLEYISILNGGTVIIYDDSPEFIAKESIKILLNDELRRKLGKEARKSIRKFKNEILLKKWIKLILSVYNGNDYYEKLRKLYTKITENKSLKLLKNQILFLRKKNKNLKYITLKNIVNFTFLENVKISF